MEQRAAWLGVERPAIECAVLTTARRIGAGSLQGKRGVEFPVGHPRGAVTTRLAAVSGRVRKGCMATSPMWQRPGSRHPDVHARAGSGSACPGKCTQSVGLPGTSTGLPAPSADDPGGGSG